MGGICRISRSDGRGPGRSQGRKRDQSLWLGRKRRGVGACGIRGSVEKSFRNPESPGERKRSWKESKRSRRTGRESRAGGGGSAEGPGTGGTTGGPKERDEL